MSRRCSICGKGPRSGIKKSHSNIKTKRMIHINLQSKKIDGVRKKVCTTCIKNEAKKNK
ncbi:50S ribosomal protein L28 [bacterium]|jgi:large subunit ribosomal protein L28|nr:50S ribosomal protein L28 [bacterium]MBT4121375.1 50S ribosomal protein L28 [bacterium]MBT4335051.1 50S ribosomal protein L28 [bacterium]MBT4495125.1 50S ribosomal protein L28 [bacterium]MBT4763865.1 50S ribosomal protein L28 [bacterium]